MLIGEYEHSIDTKGRLIMPSKLKEDIGEKFVVTKGLDGCLFVYSQTEWKTFEDKLRTFPLTNKDARALVRFFLAGAMECEIDKQGRFLKIITYSFFLVNKISLFIPSYILLLLNLRN